jgi:hypothetical protein
MEGSLTVPSFIELGHAQAIPFRLTFHLVSAGSDQPPPDGLMDSFKPTVMVTLARQMSAGPFSSLVYGLKLISSHKTGLSERRDRVCFPVGPTRPIASG